MKTNVFFYILFFVGFSFSGHSQNLYSFEDTLKCGNGGFTGYVANWTGGGLLILVLNAIHLVVNSEFR